MGSDGLASASVSPTAGRQCDSRAALHEGNQVIIGTICDPTVVDVSGLFWVRGGQKVSRAWLLRFRRSYICCFTFQSLAATSVSVAAVGGTKRLATAVVLVPPPERATAMGVDRRWTAAPIPPSRDVRGELRL